MSIYYIGDIEFKTKYDAKKTIKDILNKPRFEKRLTKSEETLVTDLFYSRDKNKVKISRENISYVFVAQNGIGSNGFFIKSKDGSVIDFSYLKCFNDLTPRGAFAAACRSAILPDKPYCKKGFERHHAGVPMAEIIDVFIEQTQIDLNAVEYYQKKFKNIYLASEFRKFHNKYARFEIVTTEQHKAIHQNSGE